MGQLDDLVMIDLITYFEQRIRSIGFPMSECSCKPGIICQQCMKSDSSRFDNDTKYGDYDNLHPDNVKTLSNHKYFLCPQAIPAYAFRTREWGICYIRRYQDLLLELTASSRDYRCVKPDASEVRPENDR